MKKQQGFTIVELIVAIVVVMVAGTIFLIQKQDLEVSARDQQRRTAINAMHYSLEEVYFKKNNFYPQTLDEKNLPSVDPALFSDPRGSKIGNKNSDYRYEPLDCDGSKCKGYIVRANLENEEDYVKRNR